MTKHIPPRRVPRDRLLPMPVIKLTPDIGYGPVVTVSTSAPTGSATDGDLWCRV